MEYEIEVEYENEQEMLIAEFFDAARLGQLQEIENILEQAKQLNLFIELISSKGTNNNSVLHMVAANGHHGIIPYLIQCGCDINSKNEHGNTPLHWAALNNHLQTVQCLLECNADKSIKNNFNHLAFDEAFTRGNYQICELLVEKVTNESENENPFESKEIDVLNEQDTR
eukprot:TRINITY_DN3354_c0_g3_i2.p1 TRINITY_DN3354_c0_g3~~TRINITY_DN3354_c0_g3_i2.p1  ORF type:complete len:170 (-),score=73.03 TRINITY_DN3354_c0_g3_i2:81-590(-)